MGKKWNDRIGLPDECALASSIIEIAGMERVLIEHHRGVCAYDGNTIKVCLQNGVVQIGGDGLLLRQMDPQRLIICGKIRCVQLERGES